MDACMGQYGTPVYFHIQMRMSVLLTMEGVTTTVQTPLVALSAVATLAIHWMEMDVLA